MKTVIHKTTGYKYEAKPMSDGTVFWLKQIDDRPSLYGTILVTAQELETEYQPLKEPTDENNQQVL